MTRTVVSAGLRDVTNAAAAGGGAGHVIKRRSQAEKQALNQAPNANELNAKALGVVLVDEGARRSNPQEVADYADPIYSYLRATENKTQGMPLKVVRRNEEYLKVDAPNTSRKRLQLVGGTCLLIASKYEEFRPPEVGDIVYIMDNAYSRDDILEMEVLILNKLDFKLTVPSPLQFLEVFRASMGISRNEDHWYLAQFLLESTLLDVKFLRHKASALAAAALYLANRIRKLPAPWPVGLSQISFMDELSLVKPLAKEIFELVPQVKTKSLFKKYSMEKYRAVAGNIPTQ